MVRIIKKSTILKKRLILALAASLFIGVSFCLPQKTLAAFNPSSVLPDETFTSVSSMTQQQIQVFLNARSGILKSYTETRASYIGPNNDWLAQGKPASEIIWRVANWYGISPQIIITTLEKEESLVSMASPPQWRIDSAMGYAFFDSPSADTHCLASGTLAATTNPTGSCRGFAIQVDWGTSGALEPNFTHAKDVGQNRTICSIYNPPPSPTYGAYWCYPNELTTVYIGNRATASIYSYTPYLTVGPSFYNIYNSFFNPYDYRVTSAVNPPTAMSKGQVATAQIKVTNTGSATWYNSGPNPVTLLRAPFGYGSALSTWDPVYWINNTQIKMVEASVAPGEVATFNMNYVGNPPPGRYVDKWIPHIFGVGPMQDRGMEFWVNRV